MEQRQIGSPLTAEQQLLLQAVYDEFRRLNDWPTFAALDRRMFRTIGMDAAMVIRSIPTDLLLSGATGETAPQPEARLRLTIRGVAHCDSGEQDVALFLRALRWIAQEETAFEPPSVDPDIPFQFSAADLAIALHLKRNSADVERLMRLLMVEQWGQVSSGGNAGREFAVGREIRRFRQVTRLDDYVVARTAWEKERSQPLPQPRTQAEPKARDGKAGISKQWPRTDRLAVIAIFVAVVLGIVTFLATVNPSRVGCLIHFAECPDPVTSSDAPHSSPGVSATSAHRAVVVQPGKETPLNLTSGGAQFSVPSRWRLRAEAANGGRCNLQIVGPASYSRYMDGVSLLVHGRQSGIYQIRSPQNCRVFVRGDDENVARLPLTVAPTGQSSASDVFEVDVGFKVTMGPGDRCGATVFRDRDGSKESQGVGANSTRGFSGPGRFWVETRTYDCELTIVPTG